LTPLLTTRSVSLRARLLIALTATLICAHAGLASAQIITTMIPVEMDPSGKPTGKLAAGAGHLMFGYAAWDYGTDFMDQVVVVNLHGGAIEGRSRSGFIVAGDFPFKLSSDVAMAIGGWYNKSGTRTLNDPQHVFEGRIVPATVFSERSTFSSLYANVFYKFVGVQAGLVPVKINQTATTPAGTSVSNRSQNDFDVFALARYTDREFVLPLAFVFGGGVYRYAPRQASPLVDGSGSPASVAPSLFGNLTLAITRHIAFDFSAWATGANNDKTHDTQTRATLGVGITF
jgi:hypothetical protein